MSIFIKRQKEDLFRDITSLGSLSFYLIISVIFLLVKNYAIFRKLAVGLFLMYALVIPIRTFYFKQRPDKFEYRTYIDRLDASSFPSLHAARTAYICLILIGFFDNSLISVFLAAASLTVLYSRIFLKKHDFIDIAGGAFVAALVYFFLGIIW